MRLKLFLYSVSLLIFFICCTERHAYAASYSHKLGEISTKYEYNVTSANCVGFNVSQGFSQQVSANITLKYINGSYRYDVYLNYNLPDDGSSWEVTGSAFISAFVTAFTDSGRYIGTYSYYANLLIDTPGSYSGYSPKTATDAANTAKTAAEAAKASADIAAAAANYIRNSMLSVSGGIVQDASGTVLTAARAARDNAANAKTSLSVSGGIVQDASGTVLTAARAARDNAANAKTSADTAASRVWDSAEGKSAATLAKEAKNNTYKDGRTAAHWAANAALNSWYDPESKGVAQVAAEARDKANTAVQNTPVIISKVQGQGGTTCTTGTTFTASVAITPGSGISYSVTYTSKPAGSNPGYSVSGNNITFNNLTVAGAYAVTITATNTATGGSAQTGFTFFKL